MMKPTVIAQMQTTTFINQHNHNTMTTQMETPEHKHLARRQLFIDKSISTIADPELKKRVRLEVNQYLAMSDEAKKIIEGVGMVE